MRGHQDSSVQRLSGFEVFNIGSCSQRYKHFSRGIEKVHYAPFHRVSGGTFLVVAHKEIWAVVGTWKE